MAKKDTNYGLKHIGELGFGKKSSWGLKHLGKSEFTMKRKGTRK